VHTSVLHSFGTESTSYSTGASVGYNPYKNMWVSVGYNVTGFEDTEFTGADYAGQGPHLNLRFKVDQESMREFLGYASFSGSSDGVAR
jgi:opacity protein-like surface antigen